MNSIKIKTNIQSANSLVEALKELSYERFPNYEVIHKMAKQDNKAVAIDLMFGEENNGEFISFTWEEKEAELVNNILSVLAEKDRREPGDYAKSEIAFFARACENEELSELIKTWLLRIATYNFGPYSKTMEYPDLTPVGYWAAFFFVLNNPGEMDVFINYLSSLRLINYNKKKWYDEDKLDAFCYPNTVAINEYLYRNLGWNHQTLTLLCAHISHYIYVRVPEMFLPLLQKNNPKKYLQEADNLDFFVATYKEKQKASTYDLKTSGVEEMISQIFPHIMDGDQLEMVKQNLITELD
jgi:hypothetical protein